jgi:rhamnosyl/mannosyltransferase
VRVLHFGRFYNDQFGGLERHIDSLLRGLKPYCELDNLVAHEGWATDTVEADGYTVHKVPSLGVLAGTALCPTMALKARSLHRQAPYDIVHLHFPDPMAHAASLFLPRRVKRVITWHSDIVRQKRLLKLYRPFLNRIINGADAILTATPSHLGASEQLKIHRHPEKLYVVPFGMDYRRFDEAALQTGQIAALRARLSKGAPLVFAVGRHVYYKGFEYLIKAMAAIPNAVLVLGGEGPLTAELKGLSRSLNLARRVRFAGRIPDSDLPLYYHACDAFCLPSIYPAEAFGLVQLEAMACGKPVVCCELNNGVTYVNRHGETGLVVPPRDPRALAVAVNTLIKEPVLRRQLGENGQRRAHREFSVDAMVAKTLDVYEKVLGQK